MVDQARDVVRAEMEQEAQEILDSLTRKSSSINLGAHWRVFGYAVIAFLIIAIQLCNMEYIKQTEKIIAATTGM